MSGRAGAVLDFAVGLKRSLRARKRVFGSWMSIGHPEIASIFAAAKGDFLGIDLEHTTIDLAAAQMIIRVCHEHRRACLPRIFPEAHGELRRLMDAGADGVIAPQISSRAQIDELVDHLRYPPKGRRSFGVAAAHRYGRVFSEYVRRANDALVLLVQVETIEGAQAIDSIASHPQVDGVLIGPYDLSGSLGIPGQLDHPKVTQACAGIIAACRRHKVSCGIHLVYPDLSEIRRKLKEGFTFFILGSDIFNLWNRSVETDRMLESL